MSSREAILTKAIEQAMPKGLLVPEWVQGPMHYANTLFQQNTVYGLIFSHEFARALWPNPNGWPGTVDPRAKSPSSARPLTDLWKARLMEMVIAEDPIAYLWEHLDA